jgi:predicted nuclease of predicted toxin-antitoxin system
MIRIILDQGLPFSAAAILRDRGWDALHAREAGMQEAADEEILAFAAIESRVVVTLDRDFPQILALTSASLPSVVLIRQQHLRAQAVADLLMAIWPDHADNLHRGCVLKVSDRGTRTRMLPLT